MNTSANPGQVAGSSPHLSPAGERWHNGKRLVLLADFAQQLAERRDLSPWDAARELLEHLAGRPEPLQLYAAPDGTEGRPVPVDHVWRAAVSGRPAFRDPFADVRAGRGRASPMVPERPAVAELRGMAGLFELLRADAPRHGGLHKALRLRLPGFAGPLALALDDAEAMLATLSPPTVAAVMALESAKASDVIQPEGSAWPHQDGQPWTEAERCALFEMRHRLKFTGDRLAEIAGASRQRIDEVIGKVRLNGGPSKAQAKDGWTPSAELLGRCGIALQPLQKAAANLRAA